jgi:hypothetical protein
VNEEDPEILVAICANCEHFSLETYLVPHSPGAGECRVNPPRYVKGDALGRWPMVLPDYWCGRFEPSDR